MPLGCCDVVLDREKFLNATPTEFGPQLYRKHLNIYTGEISRFIFSFYYFQEFVFFNINNKVFFFATNI